MKRPANLEDVAFWPVRHLAELVRTRQVTSLELTEMYLAPPPSLQRHAQQRRHVPRRRRPRAGEAGRRRDRRGPLSKVRLHGIPWGAKDIIAVKGYKTTWGTPPLKDQMLDYDASVVEMLREAGAVLHREARDRRAGVGRSVVRWADEEPVGSDGRIERIVGRTLVGHCGWMCRVRASARRRADRFSVRRRAAASPGCGRRSGASAATA